jgi:hypothetical protein
MSDRAELMELRRLAELEAKAGGTPFSPPQTPAEHVAPPFKMEAKTPENSRAWPTFKAGLVEDPATKMRVAAETMYPGDPKATDRVGMIGGRMVTVNDAGELEYVADKWGEFGAGIAANIPEMIGGTAGALSGMPVIGSTLGVMGARGLKRAGAGLVFGEPQTVGGNLKSIGREGALNLATATVGKGIAGIANRGRQVDFTPANLAEAKALQAEIKAKFGIDLNLAQASQDPKAVAMWRYLARYPSGTSSKTAGDFTEMQAGQMDAAMDALLQKFGNGYPAEMLGKEATSTAKAAIQQARKELSDEVEPLYRAAYAEVPSVTDPAIVALTKRPSFSSALDKARKMLADEGVEYQPDQLDLRLLDKTKQSLGDAIEAAQRAGNRNEARVLNGQRKQLVDWLDNASGQKYKEARAAYEAGMKSRIEPLEKGVVGLLANIKDPKAATAALKIMRDPNISGREILQAKGVILNQPNGAETWDGLTRQYLAYAWNSAQKVSQTGAELNPAGKMVTQVAGTPNQRVKLVAMLGQERGDLAMDLFDTFRKISSTEVRGSDTEFNSLISSAFKSPLARTAKAALAPRQTAMDAADRASMDRLTGLVAEAMTDPAKVRQLRAVVQMPASQKKLYLLGTILAGKSAEAGTVRGGDQLPPSYTPR